MKITLKHKSKKIMVLMLSICMVMTGILMLPASAYATDEIIAQIMPKEGDAFDITASPAYYKDDGSKGTASDYNFYYDGSKLHVKDTDSYQIRAMGAKERHMEFIGSNKVEEFFADEAKLYIEGTTNSKINIGSVGLYSETSADNPYIGISNADITINSVNESGISSPEVSISNSNLKINSTGSMNAGIESTNCKIKNSILDITAVNGLAAYDLNVTGGKLTVNATDIGIYVAEDSATPLSFNGGTYVINGKTMGVYAQKMSVAGGSISANSMYSDRNVTQPLVPTKADGKTPLYLTTVTIGGVTSSKKITSLTTTEATYKANDIYTDAAGKIYLYLPAGAKVTGAKIGNAEYTGSVTTKSDNSASGTLSFKAPTVAATPTVSIRLYGYNDVYVSWGAVSGATGYKVYYKKSTWSNYKYYKATTGRYMKFANLVDGGKYSFRVIAYKTVNGKAYNGSYRTSGSIYTLRKLGTPSVYKASSNYIRVKWGNISGETGYQIARSIYKTKSYSIVKTVSYKYSSATIKTLRNRTYYYKIRAYKTVNGSRIYGPWSGLRAYKLR